MSDGGDLPLTEEYLELRAETEIEVPDNHEPVKSEGSLELVGEAPATPKKPVVEHNPLSSEPEDEEEKVTEELAEEP